jgi:molybdate transport system ATP-binding protein
MMQARLGRKIPPSLSMDLELSIESGITAIYGAAGSGKTLLLELLAGFAMPDSGRILLDDRILFDAAARIHVAPNRRHCGYIPQRHSLFPHLTVRQNLAFAAEHFARLERHRRIAEMLERFDLTGIAASLPEAAAPECRLRAEIARLLLSEPRLILLDARPWTQPLLDGIRAVTSVPVVMVTGDLDLCCSVAGKLVLLDRGRIVQQGETRDVLEAPDSVEAARVLGIPNLFEAEIGALDPGRNTSRLEFDGFSVIGPYIRGHFRGDRVWVAVNAEDLRAHSGDVQPPPNSIRLKLARVSQRAKTVRMEFEKGIVADLPLAEYARQKDNKRWQVEFPPEALKIL